MNRTRKPLLVRWAAVTLWAGLIFLLSSQSHLPYPKGFSIQSISNLGHFGAYFMLAALLYFALRATGLSPARAAQGAVVLGLLYGLSDEFHQSFVPGRDASLADAAVDLVAACTGALLARFGTARFRSSEPA